VDSILLQDLLVRTIIGVRDDERARPQDVIINVTLCTDTRAAGASDDVADTVDYGAVARAVVALAESSRYHLLEALAEAVARLCLEHPRVAAVRVRVDKPRGLRYGRAAGVEIERRRPPA